MNSRSSVNESNLVNFSPDLASLNALDKEPLLSFPFDHLYACHSQSSDCGQSLTLDKNVEISTHCLVQPDQTIQEKDAEILSLRTQNKKLKELLVYHLDLIQQQNDVITNREKSLNTVQDEFDTLREKVDKQAGKHQTLAQRHLNPPPLFHVPTTCTVTSSHSPTPSLSPRPVLFNTIDEILGKESTDSSYLFNNDRPKPFGHDPFDLSNPVEALADLPEYIPSDLPSILDSSPLTPLQPDFNMIERLPIVKTEIKPPEPPKPKEPNYTITTNSGMPIIHRAKNRKRPTGIGSLSRMPRVPKPEPSTIYDNEIFTANRRAKMMSAYAKGKLSSLRFPYLGSLSERLQLIDTTPTGEDPYQLGEAEMREQSPIPRLVLPKNNRVRIHTGEFAQLTTPVTGTPTRRIYDPVPQAKPKKTKRVSKVKTNRRKPSTITTASQSARSASQSARSASLSARSATQSARSAPQSSRSAAQSALSAPQTSRSAAQSAISEPQSAISVPQSARSAAQRAISAPQSARSTAQRAISAPQNARSAAQSATSAPQSARSAAESAISAPQTARSTAQSAISAPQTARSAAQSAISVPQSARSAAQSDISAPQSAISTDRNPTVMNEDLDWPFSRPRQTSLVDFSYGETSLHLAAAAAASSGEVVSSGKQLPTATLISASNLDLYSSLKLEKMGDIAIMSFTELFDQEHSGGTGGDESSGVAEVPTTEASVSTASTDPSETTATVTTSAETTAPLTTAQSMSTVQSVTTAPVTTTPIISTAPIVTIAPIMSAAPSVATAPIVLAAGSVSAAPSVSTAPTVLSVLSGEPEPRPIMEVARMKKRGARTVSLAGSSTAVEEVNAEGRRGTESKRGGRKRALSSASSTKREKPAPKRRATRGRGGYRGKRGSWTPAPPLTTRSPYHTALGHPDISWYLGHDPDVKKEDVEQLAENTSSIVEVPRWREKTYTSQPDAEGTENTDDEVYRKRHQKLEAEERRQLRWHMRRVREQRHVERLRLRQRDHWTVSSNTPSVYTVWPSPLRDLQLIEITDVLPVLAFGDHVPNLPDLDFVLPWVRSSKAQKRSKRSKTLH